MEKNSVAFIFICVAFIPYTNPYIFCQTKTYLLWHSYLFSIFTCILCSQNGLKTSIRQSVKLKTDSEISIQFFVEDDIESQFCSPF